MYIAKLNIIFYNATIIWLRLRPLWELDLLLLMGCILIIMEFGGWFLFAFYLSGAVINISFISIQRVCLSVFRFGYGSLLSFFFREALHLLLPLLPISWVWWWCAGGAYKWASVYVICVHTYVERSRFYFITLRGTQTHEHTPNLIQHNSNAAHAHTNYTQIHRILPINEEAMIASTIFFFIYIYIFGGKKCALLWVEEIIYGQSF